MLAPALDDESLPRQVTSLYRKPLRRLPSGVLTAGIADAEVERFIRAFDNEKGVEDYATRHGSVQLRGKIEALLSAANIRPRTSAMVLDVGTGSGSTIPPILEVFPDSRVVATDLSLHFLEILLKRIRSDRLCALQESAEDLDFHAESFDYVLGNAVLHHLFQPDTALDRVGEVLKPGGAALFFEPCENGKVLCKLAVDGLMSDSRFAGLDPPLQKWMQRFATNMTQRWKHRANVQPELYRNKDDKWVFTRSFFVQSGFARRFSKIVVVPTERGRRAIGNNIKSKLKQHRIETPEWVVESIEDFEDQFSPEFLQDNPQALSIALVK